LKQVMALRRYGHTPTWAVPPLIVLYFYKW